MYAYISVNMSIRMRVRTVSLSQLLLLLVLPLLPETSKHTLLSMASSTTKVAYRQAVTELELYTCEIILCGHPQTLTHQHTARSLQSVLRTHDDDGFA